MDSPHDSRLELEARPLLDAPDIELGERGKRGSGSAVALFLSLLFMFFFSFPGTLLAQVYASFATTRQGLSRHGE